MQFYIYLLTLYYSLFVSKSLRKVALESQTLLMWIWDARLSCVTQSSPEHLISSVVHFVQHGRGYERPSSPLIGCRSINIQSHYHRSIARTNQRSRLPRGRQSPLLSANQIVPYDYFTRPAASAQVDRTFGWKVGEPSLFTANETFITWLFSSNC